jgi:micrococcal nuclease
MLNRSSSFFWMSIVVLLVLATFFSVSVRREKGRLRESYGAIDNGAVVKLTKVIDGDAVILADSSGRPVPVRILGIKAFDSKIEKDVVTPYSRAAVQAVGRLLGNRPVRVMLNGTPKDRYGRYLATLYVDDQDIGLRLVKEGLVLVYTVYPFPAMSLYIEQQDLARAQRKGLWANSEASDRALALARAWQGTEQ